MKYLNKFFGKLSLIALIVTTLILLTFSLTSCSQNDNDDIMTITPPSAQQFAGIRTQSLDNITQRFEFNAIPGDAGLTYFFSICFGEVFLILYAKDIDRYPGCICTYTNLKELPGFPTDIFYCVQPISYIRITDRFIFAVFTILEP